MMKKLTTSASELARDGEPWTVARVAVPPAIWVWGKKAFNAHPLEGLAGSSSDSFRFPQDCFSGARRTLQMVELMQSLQLASVCYTANFRFSPLKASATGETTDGNTNGPLFEEICQHWTKFSAEEIEQEIGLAKGVRAFRRTQRQSLIVSSHAQMRAIARHRRAEETGLRHLATDPNIPLLCAFSRLGDIMVHSMDLSSGELLVKPLPQWLDNGDFLRRSLLIMGPPGQGKTPLSRSIASVVARALQEGVAKPFFVQSNTLDSLTQLALSLDQDVPVVLDDWGQESSTSVRRPSTDGLKALLSTSSRGVLDARCSDLVLPPGPRIITSNAGCLSEWCGLLPRALLSMRPMERLNLSLDSKAVLKRLAFCAVSFPIISRGTSSSQEADPSTEERASKVRRLLASELS